MFERLGRLAVRRRIPILIATGVFFVSAGVIGGGVAERLSNGGFEDPNSESVARRGGSRGRVRRAHPQPGPAGDAQGGDVDDPAIEGAGLALTKQLSEEEGVGQVLSYWVTGIPALKSDGGEHALIAARISR